MRFRLEFTTAKLACYDLPVASGSACGSPELAAGEKRRVMFELIGEEKPTPDHNRLLAEKIAGFILGVGILAALLYFFASSPWASH